MSDATSWTDVALLDLVTIRSGQVDPKDPKYRHLPLIAPDHLSSGTGRLLKKVSAAAQGAISGKYLVMPGDIIYSKIRPYLQKAYKCEFEALCSADMYPLSPKPRVDASFILHSLLGQQFTNFATSVSARSGIPKINRQELAEYRLRAPGFDEQSAIGQTLDDADRLIEALECRIAKKQAIKQGMMQQLLTGRTRLSGFSGPWRDVQLGDIGQSLIGLTYRPDNMKSVGTLVLRSSNIQGGRLDFNENVYVDSAIPDKIRVQENDILICVRNGSRNLIGKSALLDHRVVGQTFGAFMTVFRSEWNPFLQFFFQSDAFKRQVDEHLGATINQITNKSLNGFVVALPGAKEQSSIAQVLVDADAELTAIHDRLAKARDMKTGMMQQLLTGRTRLSGEAA